MHGYTTPDHELERATDLDLRHRQSPNLNRHAPRPFRALTHRFPDMDPFLRKTQIAELDYSRNSRAAQVTIAENYVGLPLG
jgi:hypothetical protein